MASRQFQSFSEIVNFIWSLADLLRGDYKQSEYGKIILPLTVLRRLDCVLDPTKEEVLAKADELEEKPIKNVEPILNRVAGVNFHNTSRLDFDRLTGDPDNIAKNLRTYINGFSSDAREIIDRFSFRSEIQKLDREDLLYLLVKEFAKVDLHPDVVSNTVMGSIFEELIRRFSEQSNETAGEHFTPREVIRLMVNLLYSEDEEALTREGIVRTLYDPACGTGGMLSVAEEYLRELNPDARLKVFGQELNDESYAICKADMLIKGQDPDRIVHGNSFTEDGHPDIRFDYMLSNPPFGVSWKKVKQYIEDERKVQGFDGRFGAGTPRVSDGSLLFLQHMLSKMKPGGSRIAIVFNASPLFKGGAGSGESSIRQWIVENDWLEAIVALPNELFYNTGINTYIWLLTNEKREERQGKVQLIDAREFWEQMPESLGNKRKRFSPEDIAEITEIHDAFVESEHSKIFDNEDFGYHEIVIERPLRLNFRATDDRIERLEDERAFQNRDAEKQEAIFEVLRGLDDDPLYRDRDEFQEMLDEAFDEAGVDVSSSVRGNILSALGERDEDAEICRDSKGNPEHDTDLRDRERVPLKEDIEEYFQREVAPYLPDAWINEDKTRVGYEIPFTRYFYEYEPPRPLAEIEAEIRKLEERISGSLEEVLA